ncbi:MAG: universal stress protein [Ilumatobacteraceae bacterium]
MTTYIVGLDGSEHAAAALDWAQSVARADDKILAAHAWDVPVVSGYEAAGAVAPVDPVTMEDVSSEFLTGVLRDRNDPRITGELVTGNAGRALVDLAADVDGEVAIVVGHGGSSKASLLLGSTAHFVIHHTEQPVIVVRGALRLPVKRIVVGVDQGHDDDEPDERSIVALRWATRLPGVERIEVSHADFVPAVAAGPVREPGLESDDAVADDDALIRAAVEAATDGTGVPPNGAVIVPVVAGGTGAFALIEASREADLVVIGTRGRRGLMELITGSTSLDVTAHAHCPVAVVR